MTNYTPQQQEVNRAAWVAALRSGEYEQATGGLRDDGSYCCLGVACELGVRAGVVEWIKADDGDGYRQTGSTDRPNPDVLPAVMGDWLGLAHAAGQTVEWHSTDPESTGVDNLAEINDYLEWDFDQIADLIEQGGVKLAGGQS